MHANGIVKVLLFYELPFCSEHHRPALFLLRCWSTSRCTLLGNIPPETCQARTSKTSFTRAVAPQSYPQAWHAPVDSRSGPESGGGSVRWPHAPHLSRYRHGRCIETWLRLKSGRIIFRHEITISHIRRKKSRQHFCTPSALFPGDVSFRW